MKATPVIYDGETNIFTRAGAVIGWVHPANDGSGYWSQYGAKRKQNFMGCKHATVAEAEEAIRKINRNVSKNTVVIGL